MNIDRTSPTLEQLIKDVESNILSKIFCVRVGIVEKFNVPENTVDVQLVDKMVIETEDGDELRTRSLLLTCPVFILQGSKGGITIPITSGDTCLVLFGDRDIDAWWSDGNIQAPKTRRMHSENDGIALVGIRGLLNAFGSYDNSATEVSYEGTKIALDSSSITQEASNTIESTAATITSESTTGGKIEIDLLVGIKSATKDLKTVLDQLLVALINLKAVDIPAAPTQTFVIDSPTNIALTAVQADLALLLKTL